MFKLITFLDLLTYLVDDEDHFVGEKGSHPGQAQNTPRDPHFKWRHHQEHPQRDLACRTEGREAFMYMYIIYRLSPIYAQSTQSLTRYQPVQCQVLYKEIHRLRDTLPSSVGMCSCLLWESVHSHGQHTGGCKGTQKSDMIVVFCLCSDVAKVSLFDCHHNYTSWPTKPTSTLEQT